MKLKVLYVAILLLLSLGAGMLGQRLSFAYTHYQQDHQFIHWLATEIQKQKAPPKP